MRYATSIEPITVLKTKSAELVRRTRRSGEPIVIARGKQPVARLVPIKAQKQGRVFGSMRGRATVGRRFFAPLPDDEIDAWER
jgi:prevent-host-death family protein